jgi:tripartite-type tricarboxylate transporter receptor subunit TctC
MIDRRRLLGLAAAGLAVPNAWQFAQAQGKYPDRSIRVVVPRVAGGSVDVIGRGWSEKTRLTLGPSHIENQGGGGGRIGATTVARAPADGYHLLIGSTSELVLNPILETLPYDPIKNFAPIGILSTSPLVFMVDPKLPINNLKELAAYAKANPGKVNYGTAGAGTIGHVAIELFKQVSGLKEFIHIPYKGGAAAVNEVMGGRLTLVAVSISGAVVALHQSGKIRIIAVTSEGRSEALPDLPSVVEQGFPDLVIQFFIGLFAPSGLPEPILAQLEKATQVAMKDPSLQALLNKAGFDVPNSSRAEAAKFVQAEFKRWGPVLKAAGMLKK